MALYTIQPLNDVNPQQASSAATHHHRLARTHSSSMIVKEDKPLMRRHRRCASDAAPAGRYVPFLHTTSGSAEATSSSLLFDGNDWQSLINNNIKQEQDYKNSMTMGNPSSEQAVPRLQMLRSMKRNSSESMDWTNGSVIDVRNPGNIKEKPLLAKFGVTNSLTTRKSHSTDAALPFTKSPETGSQRRHSAECNSTRSNYCGGSFAHPLPQKQLHDKSMATAELVQVPGANPMHSLVQGFVHAMESVQEQRRKATSRKRISDALLTLRAAVEIHYQQEQLQLQQQQKKKKRQEQDLEGFVSDDSEQEEDDDENVNDSDSESQAATHLEMSDLGSALFSPLNPVLSPRLTAASRRRHSMPHSRKSSNSHNKRIVPASLSKSSPLPIARKSSNNGIVNGKANDASEDDKIPVQILPEPGLEHNPRLLSQSMFQQLIDEGVPDFLHMNAWERIFAIDRDGDCFQTLLDHCAPYRYTILVAQTTTGHLLGGFVSDPWQEQDGYSQKHAYYGTGLSFLFANHPLKEGGTDYSNNSTNNNNNDNNNSPDKEKELTIFPWTGSNDFCQICDKDKSTLAMGGAGAFGFILEDDFYRGSTDRCGTFDNPPLTPDRDGIFDVAAMEIYGLVPFELLGGGSPRSTTFDPEAALVVQSAFF